MAFRLNDHWVWDSWMADDGENYHLFFLRASRALHDPQKRHFRASIGHARSRDLENWELLPDALVAGEETAWDDKATWTGCTVQGPNGTWYLFYTGVSRAATGLKQSIGWATSDDLISWRRSEQPPLEADARWYETLGEGTWPDEAWRDPFVFQAADSKEWHMLITARAAAGDPDARAVVGHATSPDLETWTVQPPLSTPAGFGEMEVFQSRTVNGRHYLVFSCLPANAPGAANAVGATGSWIVEGESPLGPWDISNAKSFFLPGVYAAQLFPKRDGEWVLFGFDNDVDGKFGGEICTPIPFEVSSF